MTQAELGTIRPLRIEVETVRTGDTPTTIASRMVASERPVDQFLVLNGLAADAALTPGDRVKIVAE